MTFRHTEGSDSLFEPRHESAFDRESDFDGIRCGGAPFLTVPGVALARNVAETDGLPRAGSQETQGQVHGSRQDRSAAGQVEPTTGRARRDRSDG